MLPTTIQTRGAQTRPSDFLVGEHEYRSCLLAQASAGGTNFGQIKGGTALGQITATGELRPCGKTTANGAAGPLNTFTVFSTTPFRDGDVINVNSVLGLQGAVTLDGDGASTADIDVASKTNDGFAHRTAVVSPALGVLGTVTIVASAGGPPTADIALTSVAADGFAHRIVLTDPGVASDLQGSSTIAAGVETVNIRLANSGAAITSTVAEVIAEINATSQTMRAALAAGAGGDTAIAVASTPLAGGVAAPADRDLKAEALIAAGVETVTITLGLNALGTALASTVNEVIGAANAASNLQNYALAVGGVGTNIAAAVASTPLAGGLAVGGALATGVTVTVVSATSMTISGGAITVASGDIFQLSNGAQTAVGYLIDTVDTYVGRSAGGTEAHSRVPGQWTSAGKVLTTGLIFTNALIQADLTLIEHI